MEPTRNYELSWIWTSIQKGMNIIKGNYTWQVKNGNQVKIWEDNWITNEDIVNQPIDKEEPLPQKVKELLNEKGEWNCDLVTNLFTPEIKEKILTIHPRIEGSDKIRWKHHDSGVFSAKNIYNFVINQGQDNENDKDFPWRSLWKIQIIPRIRLFI